MPNNSFIFIVLIVVLLIPMYLQKRRADKMRAQLVALQNSLTPGLPVVTTAGLHAIVDSVDEDKRTVDLLIAPGTVARFEVSAVIKSGAPLDETPTVSAEDQALSEDPGTAGGADSSSDLGTIDDAGDSRSTADIDTTATNLGASETDSTEPGKP